MRPFAGTFAVQMRFTSVSVTTQKTSFRPRRSAASAMAKKVVRSGRSSRLRVCSTTPAAEPLEHQPVQPHRSEGRLGQVAEGVVGTDRLEAVVGAPQPRADHRHLVHPRDALVQALQCHPSLPLGRVDHRAGVGGDDPLVGDVPEGVRRTLVPVAHVHRDHPGLIHVTSSHPVAMQSGKEPASDRSVIRPQLEGFSLSTSPSSRSLFVP